MKTFIIGLIIIVLVVLGFVWLRPASAPAPADTATTTATSTASTTPAVPETGPLEIGRSVNDQPITAYRFGTGADEILFVGGIHGGYEWNTVLVAYNLMDYLAANPAKIPANVRVTVIPVLNPDGLAAVVGTTTRFTKADVTASAAAQVTGRFNANDVDLNRNFDCDWQAKGTWQDKTVSGGTGAFSEPESQAIREYVNNHPLAAAVVWYSAAGGVFASNCHRDVLPETTEIMNLYAKAAGYPAHANFNFYDITGDMVNWLAKREVPAISVLLTTHTDTDWTKNRAGVDALLAHFAK